MNLLAGCVTQTGNTNIRIFVLKEIQWVLLSDLSKGPCPRFLGHSEMLSLVVIFGSKISSPKIIFFLVIKVIRYSMTLLTVVTKNGNHP